MYMAPKEEREGGSEHVLARSNMGQRLGSSRWMLLSLGRCYARQGFACVFKILYNKVVQHRRESHVQICCLKESFHD